MYIKGIDIYGYGKLENVKFMQLSGELQGIFGQNEAGKSTIMSFIHSILFGFPTKQQNLQRYEPKTGLKYGGKVYLETTSFGPITVERIKSNHKATGEVTVTFADGTTKGEELLLQLFKGMDKASFHKVYSFDIHGIQKVHLIKSDDLGKYLFSSGMIGTDVLSNVDQMLDKELEKYFKPNGKKPLLNEKLKQLKESHQQLIKWQENNFTYNHLLQEKKDVEESLAHSQKEKEMITNQLHTLETKKSFLPLMVEKTILHHKLEQLSTYEPFPVDGLSRFKQLQARMQPYETRRFALEKKKAEVESLLLSQTVNEEILAAEAAVEKLNTSKSLMDAKRAEHHSLQNEFELICQDIKHHKELLNIKADDELFLAFNTSLPKKQNIHKLSTEYGQFEQQKQLLDEEFLKAKETLEASELKIRELEAECLPKEERIKIEKIVQQTNSGQSHQNEATFVMDSLLNCNQRIEKLTKIDKQKHKVYSLVGLIGWAFCIGLMISSIFFKYYPTIGYSVILAIFLLFLRSYSPNRHILNEWNEEREMLVARLEKLNQMADRPKTDQYTFAEAQKALALDNQKQTMLDAEKIVVKQKAHLYEKIIHSFEVWEKKWFELNEQIAKCKDEYFISKEVNGKQLFDQFQIIEQVKEMIFKKNQIASKLANLQEEIEHFTHMIIKAASSFQMTDLDENDALVLMKKRLEEEKEKESRMKQLQKQLFEIKEEQSEIENEYGHLAGEQDVLFKQAEVASEEEFLEKGESSKVAAEIMSRIAFIDGQLSFHPQIQKEAMENEEEINDAIEGYLRQLANIKEKEADLQQKLSDIKHSLSLLEEGGEYSSVLQVFNLQKSHFQDMCRKWAVLAAAKAFLSKTVNLFKSERLPAIMEEVEKNMQLLTNGEYGKVYAPNDQQTFIVERKDGICFTPDELSQATAEQLYISLRFALAAKIYTDESFPILIDDSFVNFDKYRTESAFRLLRRISGKHQVLYFSCHNHLQNYFFNHEIIKLS